MLNQNVLNLDSVVAQLSQMDNETSCTPFADGALFNATVSTSVIEDIKRFMEQWLTGHKPDNVNATEKDNTSKYKVMRTTTGQLLWGEIAQIERETHTLMQYVTTHIDNCIESSAQNDTNNTHIAMPFSNSQNTFAKTEQKGVMNDISACMPIFRSIVSQVQNLTHRFKSWFRILKVLSDIEGQVFDEANNFASEMSKLLPVGAREANAADLLSDIDTSTDALKSTYNTFRSFIKTFQDSADDSLAEVLVVATMGDIQANDTDYNATKKKLLFSVLSAALTTYENMEILHDSKTIKQNISDLSNYRKALLQFFSHADQDTLKALLLEHVLAAMRYADNHRGNSRHDLLMLVFLSDILNEDLTPILNAAQICYDAAQLEGGGNTRVRQEAAFFDCVLSPRGIALGQNKVIYQALFRAIQDIKTELEQDHEQFIDLQPISIQGSLQNRSINSDINNPQDSAREALLSVWTDHLDTVQPLISACNGKRFIITRNETRPLLTAPVSHYPASLPLFKNLIKENIITHPPTKPALPDSIDFNELSPVDISTLNNILLYAALLHENTMLHSSKKITEKIRSTTGQKSFDSVYLPAVFDMVMTHTTTDAATSLGQATDDFWDATTWTPWTPFSPTSLPLDADDFTNADNSTAETDNSTPKIYNITPAFNYNSILNFRAVSPMQPAASSQNTDTDTDTSIPYARTAEQLYHTGEQLQLLFAKLFATGLVANGQTAATLLAFNFLHRGYLDIPYGHYHFFSKQTPDSERSNIEAILYEHNAQELTNLYNLLDLQELPHRSSMRVIHTLTSSLRLFISQRITYLITQQIQNQSQSPLPSQNAELSFDSTTPITTLSRLATLPPRGKPHLPQTNSVTQHSVVQSGSSQSHNVHQNTDTLIPNVLYPQHAFLSLLLYANNKFARLGKPRPVKEHPVQPQYTGTALPTHVIYQRFFEQLDFFSADHLQPNYGDTEHTHHNSATDTYSTGILKDNPKATLFKDMNINRVQARHLVDMLSAFTSHIHTFQQKYRIANLTVNPQKVSAWFREMYAQLWNYVLASDLIPELIAHTPPQFIEQLKNNPSLPLLLEGMMMAQIQDSSMSMSSLSYMWDYYKMLHGQESINDVIDYLYLTSNSTGAMTKRTKISFFEWVFSEILDKYRIDRDELMSLGSVVNDFAGEPIYMYPISETHAIYFNGIDYYTDLLPDT